MGKLICEFAPLPIAGCQLNSERLLSVVTIVGYRVRCLGSRNNTNGARNRCPSAIELDEKPKSDNKRSISLLWATPQSACRTAIFIWLSLAPAPVSRASAVDSFNHRSPASSSRATSTAVSTPSSAVAMACCSGERRQTAMRKPQRPMSALPDTLDRWWLPPDSPQTVELVRGGR